METTKQSERQFSGVQLQIESLLSLDDVLGRLRSRTGQSTVPQINELAVADWFLPASICSEA
jgi:hypothetical protein